MNLIQELIDISLMIGEENEKGEDEGRCMLNHLINELTKNKMNLTNEFASIREWAGEKGILEKGDPKTQALKLVEEVGELAKAIIEKKPEEIADALGDAVVVMVSLAHLSGLKLELCVNEAYQEIAGRKGEMKDGTFVREK